MFARVSCFGILGLLLVACSQAESSGFVPSTAAIERKSYESVSFTATPSYQSNLTETTEPKNTPIETEINVQPSGNVTCMDPFEGEQIRFTIEDWETNFCLHSVPYKEITSGGPPPDGIPALDDPKFEIVPEADSWLDKREPVIFFQEGQDIRAYPLQILIWHEIVNDVVGERPVVITFCPLCNSALVFERPRLNGDLMTFGTSGNLRNSDLVMYDRQTESWWQQFSGEAIVGDLTGTQLKFLPASIISWADFKSQFPDGRVLSRDTGFNRQYGSNPYMGYDDINQSPFLYSGPLDDRLLPMERVLGVLLFGETGVAYPFTRLREEQVINDQIAETPIVAFWKSGTASALDSTAIATGQDIGSTGVFIRMVDDQILRFASYGDGTFVDQQTGSIWNWAGVAEEGPLQGTQLVALPHYDTFWFAWAAFVSPDSLNEQ